MPMIPGGDDERVAAVLVIGGGVGGMRAAIDLAEAGLHVYLVESTPALGGRVAQLGFMFPTHDCVLCRGTSDHGYGCTRPSITPALLDHNRHPNITVLTSTDVVACEGQAGDFTVHLRRRPQYVDPARCINCGRCTEVCPVERPSGFQMGLTMRKAISKSAPRAIPDAYYLLDKTETCDDCHRCVDICPTGAVDLAAQPADHAVHVGAVILAVGYETFNPRGMQEYGFGRYPNVVTSMQYERLASASGPTEGHVQRPSDGRLPRRIAWLQCIGSRDQHYPYCSAICCMYATKEAMLARQRLPDVEAHVFTMDERAFNKEYNAYYRQAHERYGVEYTRCRISEIQEDPQTHDLILRYPGGRMHGEAAAHQGELVEERYEMVVLAVGVRPPAHSEALATALGIELNEYGFCQTDVFSPLATSRPGIFVCGAFASPKEISETILDASGAAGEALRLLRDAPGRHLAAHEYPFMHAAAFGPERDVSAEEPRTGVFLCGCDGAIAGTLALPEVAASAARLPGVALCETMPYACFPEGLERIRDAVEQLGLNRVVIGACSHRTHLSLFQRTARESSLNPYLLEMVNLREQCAWAHASDPAGATRQAAEQMRIAVERAAHARAIHREQRAPQRSALVVGGGVTGMVAALAIADSGYDVHLVEQGDQLGGNLRHIYFTIEGQNPQRLLRDLVNRVVAHERITLHLHTELAAHSGSLGAFRSRLRHRGTPREIEIEHGVTIVATGGAESRDTRYGLGADTRVAQMSALEDLIAHQPERVTALKQVVIIQCVRPEGAAEYCSRTCCTNSLKNAVRIKMLNPHCQVVVLYKDIITYGFREKIYLEARQRGVLFVRYTDSDRPQVYYGADEPLQVQVHEHVFGETLTFQPDLLALSQSIAPSDGAQALAGVLHVPLSTEGFFLEAHLKMRPMDFMQEGVFLAGMAHYPKFIGECIANADAVAARALTVLAQDTLYIGGTVAVVDPARCTGCLTCVRTCPFGIPQMRFDRAGVGGLGGAAWIDPVQCQGCGTCTAECPAEAIELQHYRDEQVFAGLGAWHD
jgi:heterodisulfide reductase subunit A